MYIGEERIDIDPRGDTLLTLQVNLDVYSHVGKGTTSHATSNLIILDRIPLAAGEMEPHQHEGPDFGEVEDNNAGGPIGPNALLDIGNFHFNAQDVQWTPGSHEDAMVMDTKREQLTVVYKFRVSSKHLELRSKTFSELFSNARHDNEEVPLEGDDSEALVVLLNIVHGFHSKVPLTTSRDTLFEILKLIDKYEVDETALFTERWFSALEATIPAGLDQHLTKWLYICYRLRQAKHFETLTKIATLHLSTTVVLAPEARITHIINKVLARREAVLGEINAMLSAMIKLYEGSGQVCRHNPHCDALALGLLLRGLSIIDLQPLPDPTQFSGSVHDLLSILRKVKLAYRCESLHLGVNRKAKGWDFDDNDCKLSDCHVEGKMKLQLSEIRARIQGLDLSDFSLA